MEPSRPDDDIALDGLVDGSEQRRFLKNVSWTTLATLLRILLAGGTLALLGRFVSPATMGLYGLGWAAASLGYAVSQSGAAQGIIALARLDSKHIAAAQILSFSISITIAAVLFVAAPAVGTFYGNVENGRAFMIAGMFVPLMSMGAVDVSLAQRNLEFSRLALVQTVAVFLSCATALVLAWLGKDLLALYCLQGLVGFYTFATYRIFRPSIGFGRTSLSHLSDIWRIGAHLSLGSLTVVAWQNLPQLILARLVSVETLGLYVFGYRIIQLVSSQLSAMINSVVYPTFARYRSKPSQVGQKFITTVRYTYMCVAAPLIVIAAAPKEFIVFFGGAQWSAAAGILFYLALAQLALALASNVFPTFQALGKPSAAWRWNVVMASTQGLAVLVLSPFGVEAVVRGLAVTGLLMPLSVLWLSKIARFNMADYLRSMAAVVLPILPAIAVGHYLEMEYSGIRPFYGLVAFSGAALGVYFLTVLLVDAKVRGHMSNGISLLCKKLASGNS